MGTVPWNPVSCVNSLATGLVSATTQEPPKPGPTCRVSLEVDSLPGTWECLSNMIGWTSDDPKDL